MIILGCFQIEGYPKMDGENNGKPYEQMDDLGGKPHYFRKHPYTSSISNSLQVRIFDVEEGKQDDEMSK